ncbi:ABC transporter ATP-binding protein [Actinosynnema sp. NPDC059335]|uniref:ABC transporter ATP-binding protein n=1 Tax=Actinosynnema sp. NPDC059335 TaxID=3346804 RepID=UPI00366B65CD
MTTRQVDAAEALQPSPAPTAPPPAGHGLRTLLRHLRPQRSWLLAALVLGLLGAGASLAQPLLVMRVIDDLGGATTGVVLALAGLFLGSAVLGGVQGYLLQRSGEGVVLDLRRRLIAHLLHLPLREHDRLRTGDLLARAGTDTALLREVVSSGVVEALVGAVGLAGSVLMMVLIDPAMFLLVLGVVAVAATLVGMALSGIRAAAEEAQDRVGEMTADLDRALGAIRTVLASRARGRESAGIQARAEAAYRAGIRTAKLDSVVSPVMSAAAHGSFLLVLGVGGARVAGGTLALGELVAFLLYLTMLVAPLVSVLQAAASVQRGLGALHRVHEVLDLPREPDDGPPAPNPTASRAAELVISDVSFGYTEDRPVLREVSLTVPAYSRTALVGPSGTGKSTLFALVERFYDPDSGTISLDGRDLRGIRPHELRARIGYVEQEAPVLWGSLRANLCYAAPDTDEAELWRVLRTTNLTDLVERLPEGLDSEVGERGVRLSGGERQRVAIARALLCRPELLLLDEPTAQMDAENEAMLTATVRRVARSSTVVVIAHRLSTVRDVEQIAVLDRGRVVATGRHEELLSTSPLYRRLAGQLV